MLDFGFHIILLQRIHTRTFIGPNFIKLSKDKDGSEDGNDAILSSCEICICNTA